MGVEHRTAARRTFASVPRLLLVALGLVAPSTARAVPPSVRAPVPTMPPPSEADAKPPLASGESPSEADPITPHPRAAIDPPEPVPQPWSFSAPLAWPEQSTRIDVAGYLLPQFEYVSLPTGVPRDRQQYGARGSRVGFAVHGSPFEKWSYLAHVVIVPAGTESVALLNPTSARGGSIELGTSTGTTLDIEELSLAYRPVRWFLAKLGLMRAPFSVAQTTPVPKMMLPFRAPETSEFQSGADTGLVTTLAPFQERLQVNLGVLLGTSLGEALPSQAVAANVPTTRGPAIVAQVAAHPLGAMSLREGDLGRGPFRFAIGFSTVYRRATQLDPTGYETTRFDDTRFAAWVRAQAMGVYAQAEYLRRLRTDDLSGRPSISEGGYVAASYYQPIAKVAFGPVGRFGIVTSGIGFAPRKFTSIEGGLAFYPRADGDEPERLRILVEYVRASLSPFADVEREGIVQLQLEF